MWAAVLAWRSSFRRRAGRPGHARTGTPVKWTRERSESLVSDTHGRDAELDSEMALDEHGKILAIPVNADYGVGAYLAASAPVPACIGSMVYQNVYDFGAMHIHRGIR